jgi:hypothetical protein
LSVLDLDLNLDLDVDVVAPRTDWTPPNVTLEKAYIE